MIKLFSLDRMSEWQIQPHSFVYPHDFDVQEYYRHSFGIMAPNAPEPQEVILSFLGFQGKYIISLPLHSSQEVIKEGADEIQVRLKIFITHDFEMELLSYGDQVKVIKPKSLADKMRKIHERAALL